MFQEPPYTQYDIRFTLFGMPVRVHPLFWLFIGLAGMNPNTGNMRFWLIYTLSWLAAAFVSILLHELGHALLLEKIYGANTRIVLYGFGGLAIPDRFYRKKTPGTSGEIFISLAGPLSGFALAGIVAAVLMSCGIAFDWKTNSLLGVPAPGVSEEGFGTLVLFFGRFAESRPQWVLSIVWGIYCFINSLLFMSVVWGVLNLLPIYPLDGGQVSREAFLAMDRRNGIVHSLRLSFLTAAAIAVFSVLKTIQGDHAGLFIPLFFGYLAFQSYQMLLMYR